VHIDAVILRRISTLTASFGFKLWSVFRASSSSQAKVSAIVSEAVPTAYGIDFSPRHYLVTGRSWGPSVVPREVDVVTLCEKSAPGPSIMTSRTVSSTIQLVGRQGVAVAPDAHAGAVGAP